jgi:uncharacterized protein involved in exopolysaccharide biosynthesis
MSNITMDDRRGSPGRRDIDPTLLESPTLRTTIGWLLRGLRWVIILAIVGAVAGVVFGLITPARFTASSDILVDPGKLQVVNDDIYPQASARDSQLLEVESKMRVMTSGNVLDRVVSTMGLENDPEFSAPSFNLFSFGRTPPVDTRLLAQRRLSDRLRVRREEKSFVVTLSVWSADASKSVALNTALYLAFKDELAQADSDGAATAAESLSARLEELRADVNAAEAKVEDFRREHGLQSSSGELVTTQAMAQINAQVLDAQRRLVEAESRYNELKSGSSADSEVQKSETIAALRAQYAITKQQYDAQLLMLGPRHPTIVSLATQVQALEREIENEYARLIAAARNDVEQAQSVVDDLTKKQLAVTSDVNVDNEALVEMRELERDAAAKAAVYEAFLARARQVSEREQVDTTNVRLISPATPPEDRSWPPRLVVLLAGGLALGALLGALVAIGRGYLADRKTAARLAPA